MTLKEAIKQRLKEEPRLWEKGLENTIIRRIWMYYDSDSKAESILRILRNIKKASQ